MYLFDLSDLIILQEFTSENLLFIVTELELPYVDYALKINSNFHINYKALKFEMYGLLLI